MIDGQTIVAILIVQAVCTPIGYLIGYVVTSRVLKWMGR